ncbi:MAG: ferritin-like domain-containing protein [Polyangiaceae bacterium]|nr:ferritin-like domain-containing protein [Polyangiaceae bacterium]MCW5792612.1 ferritin-like domain-containing protein [Polyangiaceae bacterium]
MSTAVPQAPEPSHSKLPPLAEPGYDFQGATFDLTREEDRNIVRFILSQALYGEATGVYCGKSLYAAGSLEAARFYLRQAKQELNHLSTFAEIFRALELTPEPAHWAVKLLSSHNNYYPLKVMMEHALGEGMVLDIFKDLLLQTLPDSDPRVPGIKKKLRVVCREEQEHVAWGEKETRRILTEMPHLQLPFYGLLELQMAVVPFLTKAFQGRAAGHPVLEHLTPFLDFVRARVFEQGRALGIVPEERPGFAKRQLAIAAGLALYARSQVARSTSKLEKIYLRELGFE